MKMFCCITVSVAGFKRQPKHFLKHIILKQRKCLLRQFYFVTLCKMRVWAGFGFTLIFVEHLSAQTGSTFIIKTSDSSSPTFHRSKNKNKYQVHKNSVEYN